MVARSHLVIFASAFAHLDKCKLPFPPPSHIIPRPGGGVPFFAFVKTRLVSWVFSGFRGSTRLLPVSDPPRVRAWQVISQEPLSVPVLGCIPAHPPGGLLGTTPPSRITPAVIYLPPSVPREAPTEAAIGGLWGRRPCARPCVRMCVCA